MKHRAVGVGICLAALAVAAAGCQPGHAEGPEAKDAPRVVVVRPQRSDMVRVITLPGDLVGFYQAALYAKVSGYLKSISVDKGDHVSSGQVLAEIEVPELAQRLKRARASLEIRRVTRERLTHVWDTDHRLVAREDVDIADGKFEQAMAEVEELEALLGYTHIVAPFDGVITSRFVDPGALIQATAVATRSGSDGSSSSKGGSSPVLTLADIRRLRLYVYVPEAEASAIRAGLPATLTLREFPGRKFTGTVARYTKSLDLSTRTMLTEVDLENPTGELYPGMYADVTLELARHPDALQLPTTAVGTNEAGSAVYVVQNRRLARVPVTLGIGAEGRIEIVSGLNGDEDVVEHFNPSLVAGEVAEPLGAASARQPTARKEGAAS